MHQAGEGGPHEHRVVSSKSISDQSPLQKGESHAQTFLSRRTRVPAPARWHYQRAGVVPDYGEGRPESHREIPDLFVSAVGPREKPATDRAKGRDGAAGNRDVA